MLLGSLRFLYEGWLKELYLDTSFHFKYYGFEWVQVLPEAGMYALMGLICLSSLMILLGLYYRLALLLFLGSFGYLELIDASNYLNHYYLTLLLAFLLLFIPANRAFSLDVLRKPAMKTGKVPVWTILILIAQLSIVYSYAGLAKLNPDWLLEAKPLAIWLPERADTAIIGPILAQPATAYIFSWIGALYDCSIAVWLWLDKTRGLAYLAVLGFHLMTWLLFNIGLFPIIMILSTLIFFPGSFHNRLLAPLNYVPSQNVKLDDCSPLFKKSIFAGLALFFLIQLATPMRHLLYPGNVLWTEEGYRFSWRVMLLEKSGHVTFRVADEAQGRHTEILNEQYLSDFQEKQMSIQPDFILQFAHHLAEEFRQKHGMKNPIVTADAHVSLNGRISQQFIDPKINLAKQVSGFAPKTWILPFQNHQP